MEDTSKRAAVAGKQADAPGRPSSDGAAPLLPRQEISDLPEHERHILECLGAAVVSVWGDLPTGTQRAIFEYAAAQRAYDTAQLRAQIARFLHNHNG